MLPPSLAVASALLLVTSSGAAAASLPPRTREATVKQARSPEHLARVDWNRRQAERIEARYGRQRVVKRDANANLTFDFFSSPGYSVRCNVGTPPQELYLQLDTGSADTWVAANDRVSIALNDFKPGGIKFYDASASTSFSNLTRDVDIDYQPNRYREDAELDGYLASDSITIAGVRANSLSFGVMTDVKELQTLPTTNAGVLGMGLGVGDDTGSVAWWEAARADWSSATFGVRLQQVSIADEATVGSWPRQAIPGGGHLDLGLLNTSAYTGEISYSNVTSQERWQIPVGGLSINGRQITIESNNRNPALRTPQAVIDTSSPYTYVPHRVARAVYNAIHNVQGSDDQFTVDNGRPAELVLTIGGINYTMSTREFCTEPRPGANSLCFGEIQGADLDGDDEDDDEAPMWILGYGFLSTVYTVFTVEPIMTGGSLAPRVGFATLADNRLAEVFFNGSIAGVGGGETTQAAAGAGTSAQNGSSGTAAAGSSTPGSAAEVTIGRSLGVVVGAFGALAGVALL